jgi:hypothetical protein
VGCKNKCNNGGKAGTISKPLKKYLSNILGKHEIKKLYKTKPFWALHTYLGKY